MYSFPLGKVSVSYGYFICHLGRTSSHLLVTSHQNNFSISSECKQRQEENNSAEGEREKHLL